jgi:hypothetical protein
LSSYTVSMWVKSELPSNNMSSFFQITGTNFSDIWGQIQVGANTQLGYAGDTLDLFTCQTQITGNPSFTAEVLSLDPRNDGTKYFNGAGKWSHLVVRYEGTTHLLEIFGDGKLLGSRVSSVVQDPASFKLEPSKVLIGTFAFKDDGFENSVNAVDRPQAAHGITASLDDIQIYDTTLSNNDILALTHLGQVGR